MQDDLIRRRKERLGPEARALFDRIDRAGSSGAEIGGPEFETHMEGLAALPPDDMQEVLALLDAREAGLMRQAEDFERKALELHEAERVFDAAHEKLRSEGKPIDPAMTLEGAYRILEE